LDRAKKIQDDRGRAECLTALSPYLNESLLNEALAVAGGILDPQWQSWSMAELARHLGELGNPQKSLSIIKEIKNEDYQAYALARLAPYLSRQSSLLREALAMVVAIKPGEYSSRTDATWDTKGSQSTGSVACQRQAIVLEVLAPHLTEFQSDLYRIWNDMLHHLAVDKLTLTADELTTNNRENLLKNLRVLSPVLMNFGGAEALAQGTHAIQDVARWWP
jgi:hypothetical protein